MAADNAPCGLDDPTCPRPECCENCLPRARKNLSDRILSRCALHKDSRALDAIRAVVELCVAQQRPGTDGRMVDVGTAEPSVVLDAIADQMRIRRDR